MFSFDSSSVGSKKGWRKHRKNVSRDGLCSFTLTRHHEAEAEDTYDLAHDSERRTKNNGSGGKRGGGCCRNMLGWIYFDHLTTVEMIKDKSVP